MYNWFIGQKIVCIDDSPARTTGEKLLVLNKIYVISGFDSNPDPIDFGIILEGDAVLSFYNDGSPRGWNQKRFRPVVDKKTDISIFKKLERPNPIKTKQLEKV